MAGMSVIAEYSEFSIDVKIAKEKEKRLLVYRQ